MSDEGRLQFRYHRLPSDQKVRLVEELSSRLKEIRDVVFAYVYGGFVDRELFRDVDVAVWIRSVDEAFYYTVDFCAQLEVEMGVPVDLQVLNEAPLPFKHHVFMRGKLLFSKDENLRVKVVDRVVRQYLDYKQLEHYSI